METPHNNDPFESFLNQSEPQDDFEREAKQGFDQVSEEELRQMKSHLDQRMGSLIIPQKKRIPLLRIAASITLFIFLSLMTWYIFKPEDKQVAVQLPNTQQPLLAPNKSVEPLVVPSDASTPEISPIQSAPVVKKNSNKIEQQVPTAQPTVASDEVAAVGLNLATEKPEMMGQSVNSDKIEEKVAVAAPVRMDSSLAKGKSTARKMAAPMTSAAAPASAKADAEAASPATTECLTVQEQNKLIKQLRLKLESENLKVAFTAKLKLKATGVIEEVEIQSTEISRRDKKVIIQHIKSLKITNEQNEDCVFVLRYPG